MAKKINLWWVGAGILTLGSGILDGAASKAETDLRSQLATTQSELTAAAKERVAIQGQLTTAMAELNLVNRKLALMVEKRTSSSTTADNNAAQAQQTAETARLAADAANSQAVVAAAMARLQADSLIRVSDQSHTTALAALITSAFGFLTLIAGFFWKAFTDARDHRWMKENTLEAQSATAVHRAVELSKIDQIQSSAEAAYRESNDVNKKIESIGLKMADDKPLSPEK